MIQMLNMLEALDMRSMGLNSSRYIHTLYQVMNLSFADQEFLLRRPILPSGGTLEGSSFEKLYKAPTHSTEQDAE